MLIFSCKQNETWLCCYTCQEMKSSLFLTNVVREQVFMLKYPNVKKHVGLVQLDYLQATVMLLEYSWEQCQKTSKNLMLFWDRNFCLHFAVIYLWYCWPLYNRTFTHSCLCCIQKHCCLATCLVISSPSSTWTPCSSMVTTTGFLERYVTMVTHLLLPR